MDMEILIGVEAETTVEAETMVEAEMVVTQPSTMALMLLPSL